MVVFASSLCSITRDLHVTFHVGTTNCECSLSCATAPSSLPQPVLFTSYCIPRLTAERDLTRDLTSHCSSDQAHTLPMHHRSTAPPAWAPPLAPCWCPAARPPTLPWVCCASARRLLSRRPLLLPRPCLPKWLHGLVMLHACTWAVLRRLIALSVDMRNAGAL